MTTFPEINEDLTNLVRSFVTHVRKLVAADDQETDPVDRILAAATIAAGAVAVIWPKGRKVPGILSAVASFARQVWARRSWWAAP